MNGYTQCDTCELWWKDMDFNDSAYTCDDCISKENDIRL